MFGKKKKKAYEQQLLQQQQQANQLLSQALNKPPSALEQAKEKEQTDWLQQTNAPDFDVTKVTGMSPYLNLFNRAKQSEAEDQTPDPTAATWGGERNTALSEALRAQGSRQREQEAAGGLQQAFASKNASIRGETLPFLGYQQQRNLSLWDVLNGRSLALTQMYGRQVNQPSSLLNFLMGGANMALQALAPH